VRKESDNTVLVRIIIQLQMNQRRFWLALAIAVISLFGVVFQGIKSPPATDLLRLVCYVGLCVTTLAAGSMA